MDFTTIRDVQKRQFVETQIASVAPVRCELLPGDIVTFTNDYGIEFEGLKILGFVPSIDPAFRPEAFIYLDTESYWFSVSQASVTFERRDLVISPEQLESLWDQLSDVPVNHDGYLEVSWRQFPAGTHREDVWHWFEEQHPAISVAALMGLVDS